MKAEYTPILESYESLRREGNVIYLDIATEADASDEIVKPQVSTVQRSSKIFDVIKAIIDKIATLLKEAALVISNRAKQWMETDKGFKEQLRQRESSIKPKQAVRVVSYQYNDSYLNQIYDKLRNQCLVRIKSAIRGIASPGYQDEKLTDMKETFANDSDGTITTIIRVLVGQEADGVSGFLSTVKNTYRSGEKKDLLYKQDMLPQLIRLTEGTKEISNKCTSAILEVQTYTRQLKRAEAMIKRVNIDDAKKKQFVQYCKKALEVCTFYSTAIKYIHELKIEKSLNYRAIVRRFYQF